MLRVLMLILLLAPLHAYADDASQLGPQSSKTTSSSDGSNAASPQTSSLLQPASGTSSPLQSTDANGGGVSQSAAQKLQETGSSDDVKLLVQGEADAPQELSSGPELGFMAYILLILVLATAMTYAALLMQRRTAKS